MTDSARISPTAHYTGYVWQLHGLADPALATRRGRLLYTALQPLMLGVAPLLGGLTLERMLLRRHLAIDAVLDDWIASGEVTQVVELASGLSGRGLRMAARWRERGLVWVDTDLPAMVATRRARLGGRPQAPGYRTCVVDALAQTGPYCLSEALDPLLDASRGVAVVSEGLLNYFHKQDVERLWSGLSTWLSTYSAGRYVAELHVQDDLRELATARAFMAGLGAFVRGSVHLHWQRADEASAAMLAAGFERARMEPPEAYLPADVVPGWRRDDVMRIVTGAVST